MAKKSTREMGPDERDMLQAAVCALLDDMYDYAVSLTKGNTQDAEDVTQAAAIALCTSNAPDFLRSDFRGYVLKSVQKAFLMHCRSQDRYIPKPVLFNGAEVLFFEQGPVNMLNAAWASIDIETLYEELAVESLAALELEYAGFSTVEIGEKFGATRSKGKNMLATARKHAARTLPHRVNRSEPFIPPTIPQKAKAHKLPPVDAFAEETEQEREERRERKHQSLSHHHCAATGCPWCPRSTECEQHGKPQPTAKERKAQQTC